MESPHSVGSIISLVDASILWADDPDDGEQSNNVLNVKCGSRESFELQGDDCSWRDLSRWELCLKRLHCFKLGCGDISHLMHAKQAASETRIRIVCYHEAVSVRFRLQDFAFDLVIQVPRRCLTVLSSVSGNDSQQRIHQPWNNSRRNSSLCMH